jgi:hypothetical protein
MILSMPGNTPGNFCNIAGNYTRFKPTPSAMSFFNRVFYKTVFPVAIIVLIISVKELEAQQINFKHCTGKEYITDKHNFRAWMLGESRDQAIARKKALLNAKSELSGNMQAIIKSVLDLHYSSHLSGSNLEYLTRELINQRLDGVKIICQKTIKTDKDTFITYVSIELPKSGILADLDKEISKEGKMGNDYNKQEFENYLGTEMEKSGKLVKDKNIIR